MCQQVHLWARPQISGRAGGRFSHPFGMDGCAFDDGDTSSEGNDGFLEEFADASSRRDAGDAGPSDAHSNYTSAFVNHKAGMDGVDKAYVRRVVDEMSKNSAHYRNESRKEEKVEAKICEMRAVQARLTPEQLARLQQTVDAKVKTLERTRDVSRTWIHVDMDAFYAAVHTLEDPSLANIPMAVGGIGMISTANYVARPFQRLHLFVDGLLISGQPLGRQSGSRGSHLPNLRLHFRLLPALVPVVRGVLGHFVHDAADVRLVHPVHPGFVVDERGGVLVVRVRRPRLPRISPRGRIRELLREAIILLG